MPSFSVTAILTIGLGIGAAAAMFSVIDGVLLRPLPYPEADRIVQLFQIGDKGTRGANVSEPNFLDWQAQTRGFAAMAETTVFPQTVLGAGEPQSVPVAMVSQGFFDVMGTRPARGRGFLPGELQRGAAPVALVGARFWERWKGDRPLSGESIVIGGVAHAVVGVMPPGFGYPREAAIWTPREQGFESPSRTAHNFRVVARVRPGIDIPAASAELSRVSRAMKVRYGSETMMADAVAVPILDVMTAGVRPALRLLLAASILLLLVACTNVSNLLVARAASRQREFAVQLALGASVGRMTRQWLAETITIAGAGAVVGVGLAAIAVQVFAAMGPANAPRLDQVAVRWPAVAFAAVSAAGVALVLSLLTAWGTRSVRIADALSDSTRGGTSSRRQMRAREVLIVAQVALTMVLLAGAGLLARSFALAMAVDPGFRVGDDLVLQTSIELDGEDGPARRASTQDALLARLRALPGVVHAGLINAFPLGRGQFANGTFIEMTRPDEITTPEQFAVQCAAVPGARRRSRVPRRQRRLLRGHGDPDSPRPRVRGGGRSRPVARRRDQPEPRGGTVARPRSAGPLHPVRQHGRRPDGPARRRRGRRRPRAVARSAARARDLRRRAAAAAHHLDASPSSCAGPACAPWRSRCAGSCAMSRRRRPTSSRR